MFAKRINNDFDIYASVYENTVFVDLSKVEIVGVRLQKGFYSAELKNGIDYFIENGTIRVHVTNVIAPKAGVYSVIVTYRTPDVSADGYLDREFDKQLFEIVGFTANENDGDLVVDVNVVAASKGDSAYQVWLSSGNTGTEEDYINWIQKPSLDAAISANDAAQAANDAAALATSAALNWDKNW